MIWLIVFSACIYGTLLLWLYFSWKKIPATSAINNSCKIFVSVVIAARNEEQTISSLLKDLLQQSYDSKLFEIIVVNDHSDDSTLTILNELSRKHYQIKVFDLENQKSGKKAALDLGINKAQSNYILTLDADCKIGPLWLKSVAQCFEDQEADLVIGPVIFHPEAKGFFNKFQSLEFLSLIASGAGAAGAKRPVMCNGANLAFKKQDYQELKNQLHYEIPSGDDIFMLLALKKKSNKKIIFLKNKDALVTTHPAKSIHTFFAQRKRWASKSRYYRDIEVIALAVIIALFNFSLIVLLFMSFFQLSYLLWFAVMFGFKMAVDFALMNSFSKFFAITRLMQYFWLAELLYPFYLVFMVFYANFGSYRWKNRKYKLTIT